MLMQSQGRAVLVKVHDKNQAFRKTLSITYFYHQVFRKAASENIIPSSKSAFRQTLLNILAGVPATHV